MENKIKKFEQLTKYIKILENDTFSKPTPKFDDGGICLAVLYSDNVYNFIDDVRIFANKHPEFVPKNYYDILIDYNYDKNIKWNEFSKMDAKYVIITLFHLINTERFCDGSLLEYFKNGYVINWLKRLDELD
jgi:hypothetical protein